MSTEPSLQNTVRAYRVARGWSQQELADRAGIARASVSAIEIDRLVPSTTAALALAAVFECRVEDLFQLPTHGSTNPTWAWPMPTRRGRYWQAEVGGRTLLYPCEVMQLGAVEHDGVAIGDKRTPRNDAPPPTLVMACCDPAVGLLAREIARTSGIRVLAFVRPSRQALALLKEGLVHVAGTHLGHSKRDGNAAIVRRELGAGYQMIRAADWEEGVAVAVGHSESLRTMLASRLRWVGREVGSGARQCLDELLEDRPAPNRLARDHRGVAEAIRSGWADAGVCLELAAAEANLNFVAVRREAYDLCYAASNESDPRIRALIAALQSKAFRTLLGDLPGYHANSTGTLASTS